MRWREVSKENTEGRRRVGFFGDSFTFGCWAEDVEHSLVGVFEKSVSPERWEVLNFGVGGYGFADIELQLEEEALEFDLFYAVLVSFNGNDFRDTLSIIIIDPGLDSRARTALEHMLESVVSARGKVLRTNFSATSRVTRATKLTQAASRHSYRWCSPPTRGSATTFAVGDGRCVTVLKLGVSLFSPKWQRSS